MAIILRRDEDHNTLGANHEKDSREMSRREQASS